MAHSLLNRARTDRFAANTIPLRLAAVKVGGGEAIGDAGVLVDSSPPMIPHLARCGIIAVARSWDGRLSRVFLWTRAQRLVTLLRSRGGTSQRGADRKGTTL
jgi:hypothetical protein